MSRVATLNDGGRPWVLAVDDEPDNLRFYERVLRRDYRVLAAASAEDALVIATKFADGIRAVVTDQRMSGMSGAELLGRLHRIMPEIPKIIVTAFLDTEPIVTAVNNAWLYALLLKPVDARALCETVRDAVEESSSRQDVEGMMYKLQHDNQRLQNGNQELRLVTQQLSDEKLELDAKHRDLAMEYQRLIHIAHRDSLTELYNRRKFDDDCAREFSRFQRYGRAVSMVVMDVDGFKALNDTHGHPAGDQALVRIAGRMRSHIRDSDVAFRIGGDEFAVLLPETSEADATRVARKIRKGVQLLGRDDEVMRGLGLSFGVATLSPSIDSPQTWYAQADERLYVMKQGISQVSGGPRLLAIGSPQFARASVLKELGEQCVLHIGSIQEHNALEQLDFEPDVCLVDLQACSPQGVPALDMVRATFPHAPCIALGAAADPALILDAVNSGAVSRFFPLNTEPEVLLEEANRVWSGARTLGVLRRRLSQLNRNRALLRDERRRLLSAIEHTKDAPFSEDDLPGNVLRPDVMARRIAEEVERSERYGHPLALVELAVDGAETEVCQALAQRVRNIDRVSFRHGVVQVLLPATTRNAAQRATQRLVNRMPYQGARGDRAMEAPRVFSYPEDKTHFA